MKGTLVEYSDRADWLAKRREGIGASDIAGVLGISPYTTPFQVWADKVYEMPDNDEGTEAMAWGRRLESIILDTWESGLGRNPVINRGDMWRSIERPWMLATPDGRTLVRDDTHAVVDAKNISDYSWDEIPEYYVAQVQWQMAVTGDPLGYLIVLHGGRRLETYEIEADPAMQAEMIAEAEEFWKLVEANEPPSTEGADIAILNSLFPQSVEQAVEIPVELAAELYEARMAYADAEDRKKTAESAVRALLGEADTAVVGDKVVATWRTTKPIARIDTKRFRAERPDLAKTYEKTSTERRFLVKGDSL